MENIEDLQEILNENSDEDEETEITPGELIEMMEEAWINEKFAPEILPHKSEVVNCLLGQITYMEENIKQLSSTDFRKSIHQIEVDRLRYLVASYLRIRLEKIETYVTFILSQEEQRRERQEETYLSEEETEFAKDYYKSLEDYFATVTSFYPGLPADNLETQQIKPNMHSFVFAKSKKEIEGVIIDDGSGDGDQDVVDVAEGAQIIISYKSIADLVNKGDIQLI